MDISSRSTGPPCFIITEALSRRVAPFVTSRLSEGFDIKSFLEPVICGWLFSALFLLIKPLSIFKSFSSYSAIIVVLRFNWSFFDEVDCGTYYMDVFLETWDLCSAASPSSYGVGAATLYCSALLFPLLLFLSSICVDISDYIAFRFASWIKYV